MTATRRLPPRMPRTLILSALLGVAMGVAAWLLGMDAAHAIGLGAAAFGLSACLSALGEVAEITWATPPAPSRTGSRRDVAQLGWSLGARGGRASSEGVRAVRSVAERAVALRGLDLEDRSADAQLEALLGRQTLALLRRGSGVEMRTSALAAVLDRLEALIAETASAAPASRNGRASVAPTRTPTPAPTSIPTPEEPPRVR
ncbi:MAG: hypothetical protein ACTHJI_05520 [Leifsonia sp.]